MRICSGSGASSGEVPYNSFMSQRQSRGEDGRRRGRAGLIAATFCAITCPAAARAERPASTGFYAEASGGATAFVASVSSYAAVGPSLAVRIGSDLFSWLSLGVHVAASSHEALVPPPPQGEWFQLARAFADARISIRRGAIAGFIEGGAGAAYMSSNVLAKVMVIDPGEHFSLAFTGGAGVEYQLQNRHYAAGVAGGYWLMPQFAAAQGVEGRVFLRYTY